MKELYNRIIELLIIIMGSVALYFFIDVARVLLSKL